MTTKAVCRSTAHHGTYWAYSKHGCRCLRAVLDESRYRRLLRSGAPTGLVRDATGACRIARGLAAYGYTVEQIAAAAGVSTRLVSQLHAGKATVLTSKDAALRAAAGRLIAGPPPTGWAASRARSAARRGGWAPLLAWDDDTIDDPHATPDLGGEGDGLVDEVAIARVLAGDRSIRLTAAEQAEALRVGMASGMPMSVIAGVLRMSYEQVNYRARQAADQAA